MMLGFGVWGVGFGVWGLGFRMCSSCACISTTRTRSVAAEDVTAGQASAAHVNAFGITSEFVGIQCEFWRANFVLCTHSFVGLQVQAIHFGAEGFVFAFGHTQVWVLGFGVWGLGFGVWGLGFEVWVLQVEC